MANVGPDEAVAILEDYESGGLTIPQLEYKYGRSDKAIRGVIRKYSSTTRLAGRLIQANAITLATRVIKHATVAEAIDVLSRPNMDVLKPIKKEETAVGFFTSVSLDSCGAVKEVKGAIVYGNQIPGQANTQIPAREEFVEGERVERGSRQIGPARGYDSRPDSQGDEAIPGTDAGTDSQEVGSLVVGPPVGYSDGGVTRTRARSKRTPKFKDPHPPREMPADPAKRSKIHLRYD